MAKSTVEQALASLQFKFQNKIKEVGTLRAKLQALTAHSTTPDEDTARALHQQALSSKHALAKEAQSLLRERDNLRSLLAGEESRALRFSFIAQDAQQQVLDLQVAQSNTKALNRDLKESVANWKQLAVILFFTGASIGALGYMAYLTQAV